MSGHTKEPLTVIGDVDVWSDGEDAPLVPIFISASNDRTWGRKLSLAERQANADRLVACWNAMAGVDDPVTMVAEIEDVLTRVAEHLDRYSDVNDGDYGEPEANKEMLLLSAIKPLLSRMGGGE